MKKLVLTLMLVLGLTSMASAAYIGLNNPLKVDIDGSEGAHDSTKPGWHPWLFPRDGNLSTPQIFPNPQASNPWEIPQCELDVYEKRLANPEDGGMSRPRSGGWAGVHGTGDYSPTGWGFGTNYVVLTLSGLQPNTNYKYYLWSYDARNVWAASPDNPNSKFGVWCTMKTDPKTWLDEHAGQYTGVDGNDPEGYPPAGPLSINDSGMPGTPSNPYTGTGPSLYDLVCEHGGRCFMMTEGDLGDDPLGGESNVVSFYAPTNADGSIVIYGWIDPTDWTGSMYMPLNGFMVIPEPATLALLSFGGLALVRKRRA